MDPVVGLDVCGRSVERYLSQAPLHPHSPPRMQVDLITAGLAAEASVSGYHADNVGPSLLGGFVLIR